MARQHPQPPNLERAPVASVVVARAEQLRTGIERDHLCQRRRVDIEGEGREARRATETAWATRQPRERCAVDEAGALRVGQAHAVVRPGEGVTVGRCDGELSIGHHGSGVRKRWVTELAKMETLSFSCASQAHTTTREQSRAMGIMHLYLCYPLTLANTVCVPRQYAWWWHT